MAKYPIQNSKFKIQKSMFDAALILNLEF
jgi:hypothetical protein